jgi:hypothetical protein
MFEKRVPKRDEVTGEWQKLHNKELCDLYFSPKYNWNNEVEDEMCTACSTKGRGRRGTPIGYWWERDH